MRCCLVIILLAGTQLISGTECDGGLVNGDNVPHYTGCTRVSGSIVINSSSLQSDGEVTSQLLFDQLEALSNIQEITGYLLIENLDNHNFTNLRFLRNLMVILGQDTLELRPGQHYSLVVSNNPYLETANFGSLLSIVEGGVRITNNPELCLIDTITLTHFLVNSALRRVGGLGQDCNEFACHVECNMAHGCWGTLPDECVGCSNYQYQGTCVPACNISISYVNETSLQCVLFPSNTQSEEPSTSTSTIAPVQTTIFSTTASPSVEETPPPSVVTTSVVTMTTTLEPNGRKQLKIWVIASSATIAIIFSTSTIGIAITVYICHRKKSKHLPVNQPLSKGSGSLRKYSGRSDKIRHLQSEENSLNTHKQKRQRVSLSALARETSLIGNKRNSDSEPIDIHLHSRPSSSDLEDHVTSHGVHMTAHEKHMIAQRASKILTNHSNNHAQITTPSSKGEPPQYLTNRGGASTSPRLGSSHKPNFQQQTQWPMVVGGVYSTRHAHNSSHHTMRRGSSSHGTSTRTSFSSYRHSMTSNSGLSSVRTVVSNHGSENSLPVSPDQSPRVM